MESLALKSAESSTVLIIGGIRATFLRRYWSSDDCQPFWSRVRQRHMSKRDIHFLKLSALELNLLLHVTGTDVQGRRKRYKNGSSYLCYLHSAVRLFLCTDIFNDVLQQLRIYLLQNCMMGRLPNDELPSMWKKADMVQFWVLPHHLSTGTQQNHEELKRNECIGLATEEWRYTVWRKRSRLRMQLNRSAWR